MHILSPPDSLFSEIKHHIHLMQLDNRELRKEEFLVATENGILKAFGRTKKYETCEELCSLGVPEEYRGKYIGQQLVKALIAKAGRGLYVVCIIPAYFEKLGFQKVNDFPEALLQKKSFCETTLGGCTEGSQYCVMRYYSEAAGSTET